MKFGDAKADEPVALAGTGASEQDDGLAGENVDFETAWGDLVSGTVWCVSEASSAEAGQRIHEHTGQAAVEMLRVPVEV